MELANVANLKINFTNNVEDVVICGENWENYFIAETVK